VDDSPSACSCARIDAENFHAVTLGIGSDVPARAFAESRNIHTAT
jgi:hypothetical protein